MGVPRDFGNAIAVRRAIVEGSELAFVSA